MHTWRVGKRHFTGDISTTIAQHENPAAKGIFGVRVPLRFFFLFRLNKNNPLEYFPDQEFDKFQRFWYKICYDNLLGKYFNIELKSIVAQHENLAAKGIFGVRVPLKFCFSFRLNKNDPAIFSQINSWTNSEDFNIKFIIITPSESILIFRWIISNSQKLACFEQFVWAWYNIFASFFALDVMFRTCSFIFLRLFCCITSF